MSVECSFIKFTHTLLCAIPSDETAVSVKANHLLSSVPQQSKKREEKIVEPN